MQYRTQQFSFGPGRVTPAVKFLLIANTAMFVVQTLLSAGSDLQIEYYLGLVPRRVIDELFLWQLFTYQFLHAGIFHILFNMLAVWMFGCDLEQRWGSGFFLRYYSLCVLGGGLLNTLFAPGQMGPSVGASAGVYGLLLAYGLIYPNRIIYFYFLFPMKMKHFVWIIGAIALYSSIATGQGAIAHLAHLGGMVFGFLYLRGGAPSEWFKDYLDRRRLARLKRKFHLHSGGKDDRRGPTLH